MVEIIDKLTVSTARLIPNVRSSFCDKQGKPVSAGKLIYCTECLNKTHLAPFRSPAEIAQRLAEFTEQHKNCR